jgi:hypothetical protein
MDRRHSLLDLSVPRAHPRSGGFTSPKWRRKAAVTFLHYCPGLLHALVAPMPEEFHKPQVAQNL